MREVIGYEGLYSVTSCGKVWSHISNRFMKQKADKDGYLVVNLHKGNEQKTHRVHRLIAAAFLPNPTRLPQVNHRDENRKNNNLHNLEWCTHDYNQRYGTHREKLSVARSKQVYCVELDKVFRSAKDAAEKLGLDKNTIGRVCNGYLRTTGGYHWKFKEALA